MMCLKTNSHAYDGLNNVNDMTKILLPYVDDTVYFAESDKEQQAALNAMFLYCKSWDLEVDPAKTKITLFLIESCSNILFSHGQELEIDDGFVYLGTQFSYNGRFQKHNQRLADRARKAMFAVLRKSRKLHLPVDF